ncbi:DNA gyrase, B subunit, partial [Chlamydia psittaci 08DC60]
FQKRRWMIIY